MQVLADYCKLDYSSQVVHTYWVLELVVNVVTKQTESNAIIVIYYVI